MPMIWSVQLTPWLLPPLLGVLIALRDATSLWSVRREPAAGPLLILMVTSGTWALLHLSVVATVPLDLKLILLQLEYVPAALVPVAWAWFALSLARRRSDLVGVPMLLLIVATVVTVWLAVDPARRMALLGGEADLRDRGSVAELAVSRGTWHWIHLAVREGVVLAATGILALHVARIGVSGLRVMTLVTAAAFAVVPTVVHLALMSGNVWTDVSSLGFVAASSVLGRGLLKGRLEGLGPVARSVVMEELRDPVVVLDGKGRIVDVNRAAEEILQFQPYGDVPLSLGTLWASARERHAEEFTRVFLPVPADGPGAERPFEVTVTPLEGRTGDGRVVLVLRDVTARDEMEQELRLAHKELERLVNIDSLTGLANRRAFMEVLDGEIERADRYERPLSVVLLDLDHFKKVNDSYGHAAGDDVLRAAAEVLRSVCRDVDLAARLGGEELALILPETDREGARIVAERVRARIESTNHEAPEGSTFQVTASIGVAWMVSGVETGEALLQRADKALYRAKSRGRNQVALSS